MRSRPPPRRREIFNFEILIDEDTSAAFRDRQSRDQRIRCIARPPKSAWWREIVRPSESSTRPSRTAVTRALVIISTPRAASFRCA